MLLYGDAQSHLNVARHVTDGLRPGLAQLGSVWLPIPHILLVPLAASNWMWHSGAAGAIVGGCCFVYSAVRIYTLIEELTGSRIGAWCGFAVFVCNLNLLYLQSTALTEPVLLAFLVGAIFHLARWLRTRSVVSLAMAGLLTFLATLTRYEGWVLLVTAAAVVGVWTWRHDHQPKEVEANVVLFVAIGGYGIVLWVLYNLIIFHNPLYFIQSTYSAQAQQKVLSHVGMLKTSGHLMLSVLTYGWTVIDVLGPTLAIAAALSVLALFLIKGPTRRRSVAVLVLLAAPLLFNAFSLWRGQTTVRVPQVSPYGMWNDRYGTMALPLAAVALGLIAGRWRRLVPIAVAVTLLSFVLMTMSTPITIKDGRIGTSSAIGGHPDTAAAYLHRHYLGGEVLADDSLASPFMFESGLDLKEFVTVGFEPWYNDALRSPASSVAWVVAIGGDAVSADMSAQPGRYSRFKLVATYGRVHLYQREPLKGRSRAAQLQAPPAAAPPAAQSGLLPYLNAQDFVKQVRFGQYTSNAFTQIGKYVNGQYQSTNVGGGAPVYANVYGGFVQDYDPATLPNGTGAYIPTSLMTYTAPGQQYTQQAQTTAHDAARSAVNSSIPVTFVHVAEQIAADGGTPLHQYGGAARHPGIETGARSPINEIAGGIGPAAGLLQFEPESSA
jgi:hypothetical protein